MLKLWRKQERRTRENGDQGVTKLLASRLPSLPPPEHQLANPDTPFVISSSSSSESAVPTLPPNDSSSTAVILAAEPETRDVSNTPTSKPWVDVIEVMDDEEEDEKVTLWKSSRQWSEDKPDKATVRASNSNLLDDISCLSSSLNAAQSIGSLLESASTCTSSNTGKSRDDHNNSSGIPKALFVQLRSSQSKAQGLGMRGTFINPLLITVLEAHVRLVQTMSESLASKLIELVPAGTMKDESSMVVDSATATGTGTCSNTTTEIGTLVPSIPQLMPASGGISAPVILEDDTKLEDKGLLTSQTENVADNPSLSTPLLDAQRTREEVMEETCPTNIVDDAPSHLQTMSSTLVKQQHDVPLISPAADKPSSQANIGTHDTLPTTPIQTPPQSPASVPSLPQHILPAVGGPSTSVTKSLAQRQLSPVPNLPQTGTHSQASVLGSNQHQLTHTLNCQASILPSSTSIQMIPATSQVPPTITTAHSSLTAAQQDRPPSLAVDVSPMAIQGPGATSSTGGEPSQWTPLIAVKALVAANERLSKRDTSNSSLIGGSTGLPASGSVATAFPLMGLPPRVTNQPANEVRGSSTREPTLNPISRTVSLDSRATMTTAPAMKDSMIKFRIGVSSGKTLTPRPSTALPTSLPSAPHPRIQASSVRPPTPVAPNPTNVALPRPELMKVQTPVLGSTPGSISALRFTKPLTPVAPKPTNAFLPNPVPIQVRTPVPASAPTSARASTSYPEPVPQYRLNSNTRTVLDIWNEWTTGFQGGPSIISLHEKFDLRWLDPEDRLLYRENRSILLEAEKLVRTKRLTAMCALEVLETTRLKVGMDIRLFAKSLAQSVPNNGREKGKADAASTTQEQVPPPQEGQRQGDTGQSGDNGDNGGQSEGGAMDGSIHDSGAGPTP